jgi:hypothetical protein
VLRVLKVYRATRGLPELKVPKGLRVDKVAKEMLDL